MQAQKIYKAATILAILVLIVIILVYAKNFLIPLTFAALLAMLLLPITKWLQEKGLHKALAILLPILLLIAGFGLIIYLVSWQISDLSSGFSQAEEEFNKQLQQAQSFVAEKLGISAKEQEEMLKKQQSSSMQKSAGLVSGVLLGIGAFITDMILVLVYIFLFMFFRHRIKGFVQRLVSSKEQGNVEEIFSRSQHVTQKYLGGLALMIVGLWIMYGIGFSIVGVKHAIFFAILCGLLEIVPFIGNLTGTGLTILMSLVQGGGMNMVLGILITYAIVQFIQTYILEPLVVGSEVNINPLFTIVGLVAGEAIWGIPGMILAIPIMGVVKITCDNIDLLKPYGYLLGEEKKKESGFKTKIKDGLQKVKSIFSK